MFVCLGNICRSLLAHTIIEMMVEGTGLSDGFRIASSGMGLWHVGQWLDRRMRQVAMRHGYLLAGLRAQQFEASELA